MARPRSGVTGFDNGAQPQTGSSGPIAVQVKPTPRRKATKRMDRHPARVLPEIFGQLLGMLARKQYMTGATPWVQGRIPAPQAQRLSNTRSWYAQRRATAVSPHVTADREGRGRVHATLSIRICPKATRGKVAVVVHAIVVV